MDENQRTALRIGIVAGAFDLLHAGHVLMMREAKTQCDYLIVALQTDPSLDRSSKNKPVQSITERYIQVDAVKYVDEMIVYETEYDLLQILEGYDIDVRIIGDEYQDATFTGSTLDIEIYYNKRRHNFSSSKLRKRVEENGQ